MCGHYDTSGLRLANVIREGFNRLGVLNSTIDGSRQPDLQRFRGFPIQATLDNGQRAINQRLTEFSDLQGHCHYLLARVRRH